MKICLQCREIITGSNINPNYRGMEIHYGQDWYCGPVVEVSSDTYKNTLQYLNDEYERIYGLEERLIELENKEEPLRDDEFNGWNDDPGYF